MTPWRQTPKDSKMKWNSLRYSHGKDIQGVNRASNDFKVILQYGDGAGECLMATAAEKRHASVEQDGGDQRRIRDATQALDAALKAA